MEILVGMGIFLLALLGVPLFVVMGLAALVAFSWVDIEISAVAIEMSKIAGQSSLVTIPLFTFAGYLLAESRSPARLTRLASAAVGWMPGGVAVEALVICALFTAFTGASGVAIVALGGLLYPILRKNHYSERFSLGLITTSGSLGLLFPPSLPLILYGLVAKVDIEKLFLAGILPGILLIGILSGWSVFKNKGVGERKSFCFKEFYLALNAAKWEALLPVGVLVGIYGGFTTVTEAAALTAFYVLIIECFVYRDISFMRDVPRVIGDSMTLVGGILLILCCALGVTNFLVDQEVPTSILQSMREVITNKYTFLLFLNIFLLAVGALMDIFSAIIVVTPLIVPIAADFGIHPVHLAIIFLANLEIGYITPPVGINIFISSFRFKKSLLEIYRSCWHGETCVYGKVGVCMHVRVSTISV